MKFFRTSLIVAAVFLAAATVRAQEAERRDTLQTSYVTAVKEKMRNTTQTGLTRIDGDKLRSGVAVFGSPDIIKQLQILPGVAAGNELSSGLYVHGGDGNDNLFLLDGVPLYNITHFGGLFSSFNTDVVDNLDFYKSGFPARYGGRLSSVVDVETAEGDMLKYHGNVSIGLIDGRVHAEGPIVPGRTSFNVGLRRSWLDIVTVPALAYANWKNGEDTKVNGGYAMSDFNARITHIFSGRSKLNAGFYWGLDNLHAGLNDGILNLGTSMKLDIGTKWGTTTANVAWNYDFSKQLRSKLLGYWSRSGSDVGYSFDITEKMEQESMSIAMSDHNISAVSDAGIKYDLDWFPNSSHHVRFGTSQIYHHYNVSRTYEQSQQFPGVDLQTDTDTKGGAYDAFEPALYIEDEIFLTYNITLNAGMRASLFVTKPLTWGRVEPRAAFKWLITKDICAKMSYTRMSQYSHLVSAMYIELPTNSWMPSTWGAGPMMSDQVAGCLYFTPGPWEINLEGWYKTMDNMLAYNGANAFYPPLVNWETSFTPGKGKSWGFEFEATFRKPKIELSAYYTLSWSMRQFDAWYSFPFPDRNDNRHKINLVGTWRPTKGISLFWNWNYHSGNRITLPTHVINYGDSISSLLFQAPYNSSLPDYHRLDIGADFSRKLRNGTEFNVNVSIYNVYNHLNAAFAMLQTDEKGEFYGLAYGLVPIIPTVSVGFKF